jgi:hypothetical protein
VIGPADGGRRPPGHDRGAVGLTGVTRATACPTPPRRHEAALPENNAGAHRTRRPLRDRPAQTGAAVRAVTDERGQAIGLLPWTAVIRENHANVHLAATIAEPAHLRQGALMVASPTFGDRRFGAGFFGVGQRIFVRGEVAICGRPAWPRAPYGAPRTGLLRSRVLRGTVTALRVPSRRRRPGRPSRRPATGAGRG